MYTKKQRLFVSLICAAIIVAALFSLSYVIHESAHDCTGENCPVCAYIHNAKQNFEQLGTGLVSLAGLALVVYSAVFSFTYAHYDSHGVTLIGLKVRLNN